ncbi:MAG: TetR/AcrR family transcriptional regulator [Microthrixaceae bacterium]|nr:TetR/AcrR family transcriptional regulator [Microthrixaceae bacterium]
MTTDTPTRPVDPDGEEHECKRHGGEEQGTDAACPGRPRDPAVDEAILAATASLLTEAGFEGLTVEQVAARAGVSKASLYRRFDNLADLLAATCVAFAPEAPEVPDTGSTREDLLTLLAHLARTISSPDTGGPLPAILAAAGSNEEARRALSRFSTTRGTPLRTVATRAVEQGELPAGTDATSVADMLAGAVLFRSLVRDERVDLDRIASYVDLLLRTGR